MSASKKVRVVGDFSVRINVVDSGSVGTEAGANAILNGVKR